MNELIDRAEYINIMSTVRTPSVAQCRKNLVPAQNNALADCAHEHLLPQMRKVCSIGQLTPPILSNIAQRYHYQWLYTNVHDANTKIDALNQATRDFGLSCLRGQKTQVFIDHFTKNFVDNFGQHQGCIMIFDQFSVETNISLNVLNTLKDIFDEIVDFWENKNFWMQIFYSYRLDHYKPQTVHLVPFI